MADYLRFILTANNKAVLASIGETADASEAAAGRIDASDSTIAASNDETLLSFDRLKSGAGLLMGALGLGAVAYGIKDLVQAGSKWQAQQAALGVALKNTGQYSKGAVADVSQSVEKLSTHGGFSASQQLQGITQLVGKTKDLSEAMKLNADATDLARGTGLEYSQTLRMIEMAQAGSARGLQKYIQNFEPVTTAVNNMTAAQKLLYPAQLATAELWDKQQTALELNTAILKQYGNQTKVYSNTTAGQLSNLRNTFDILAKNIGTSLLPLVNKLAGDVLKFVRWTISNWPHIRSAILIGFAPVRFIVKELGGLKGVLITIGVIMLGWTVYSAIIRGVAAAVLIYRAAVIAAAIAEALMLAPIETLAVLAGLAIAAIGGIVVAIALLAAVVIAGFVFMYLKVGWFRTAVQDVFGWIVHNWKLLVGILLFPFTGPIALIILYFGKFKKIVDEVIKFVIKRFNDLWGIVKGVAKFIGGVFDSIGGFFGLGGSSHHTVHHRHGGPANTAGSGVNNSIPATSRTAANGSSGTIVLHHQTVLDKRVLAESTTHYVLSKTALSSGGGS